MYICLRLEYSERCVETLQLPFLFCKANWQSYLQFTAESLTSGVDFSISAESDNFVFLAIPAGTAAFACEVRFTPPWSEICN